MFICAIETWITRLKPTYNRAKLLTVRKMKRSPDQEQSLTLLSPYFSILSNAYSYSCVYSKTVWECILSYLIKTISKYDFRSLIEWNKTTVNDLSLHILTVQQGVIEQLRAGWTIQELIPIFCLKLIYFGFFPLNYTIAILLMLFSQCTIITLTIENCVGSKL